VCSRAEPSSQNYRFSSLRQINWRLAAAGNFDWPNLTLEAIERDNEERPTWGDRPKAADHIDNSEDPNVPVGAKLQPYG